MNEHDSAQSSPSNVRPYGIFITYLSTCLAVAVFIITKLVGRRQNLQAAAPSPKPPRTHVVIFAILAACSLLSTWGFMFRYFQWSYDNWLALRSQHGLDPSVKHWGLWLMETSLFKEAWASVVIGHNRYWWSHQIFFFALALGLHSEWKGLSARGFLYADIDSIRASPRNHIYLGIYASWTNCSHQLRYEPLLLNIASQCSTANSTSNFEKFCARSN
jgi:magnesium-transporting ATPase (P-type)